MNLIAIILDEEVVNKQMPTSSFICLIRNI